MVETAPAIVGIMPVIVVGADTRAGVEIITALAHPGREIRAFVTNEEAAAELRLNGVKVALGDVSDEGHVEAAATACFSAVLITEAAHDRRERSFAATAEQVIQGWARAVVGAGVSRVIWVAEEDTPEVDIPEVARVAPSVEDLARRVASIDDAQSI